MTKREELLTHTVTFLLKKFTEVKIIFVACWRQSLINRRGHRCSLQNNWFVLMWHVNKHLLGEAFGPATMFKSNMCEAWYLLRTPTQVVNATPSFLASWFKFPFFYQSVCHMGSFRIMHPICLCFQRHVDTVFITGLIDEDSKQAPTERFFSLL